MLSTQPRHSYRRGSNGRFRSRAVVQHNDLPTARWSFLLLGATKGAPAMGPTADVTCIVLPKISLPLRPTHVIESSHRNPLSTAFSVRGSEHQEIFCSVTLAYLSKDGELYNRRPSAIAHRSSLSLLAPHCAEEKLHRRCGTDYFDPHADSIFRGSWNILHS